MRRQFYFLPLFLLASCAAIDKHKSAAAPGGQTQVDDSNCTVVSGPNFSNQKVCYKPVKVNGKLLPVLGDIKLGRSIMEMKAKKVLANNRFATSLSQGYQDYFWPAVNGQVKIPYTIESSSLTTVVTAALADLQARSGVTFIPRTTQTDYLNFVEAVLDETSSYITCGLSFVGNVGDRQDIELSLNPSCRNAASGNILPTVQHEVMHALGFWHEQNRLDRDDYVRVFFEHMDSGCVSEFAKILPSDGVGPYDVRSIMHYEKDVCSVDGSDVMQPLHAADEGAMGHSPKATDADIAGIMAVYGPKTKIVVAADERSALFTFHTANAIKSHIRVGLASNELTLEALNSTSILSHSISVAGLTPKKRYFYQIETAANVWSPVRSFVSDGTPPVISDIRKTLASDRSLEFRFTTNEPTTSLLLICEDPDCIGPNSFQFDDPTYYGEIHNYQLLLKAKVYYVIPYVEDAAGNWTLGLTTTVDADNAPPVISQIAVTTRTSTGATISWTTNELSTSYVDYGTTAATQGQNMGSPTLVKAHTVVLTGLPTNALTYYKVRSADAKGQSASSAVASFSTDVTPPVLTGVIHSQLKLTSARITWSTSEGSTSVVKYGTSCGSLNLSKTGAAIVTSHTIDLTALTAATTYCYQAFSTDGQGNTGNSDALTFTTPVNIPPVLSAVVATQGINSMILTWTTYLPSDSRVEYGTTSGSYPNSGLNASSVTNHSVTLTTGLVEGQTYFYRVSSTTAEGAKGQSVEKSFVYRNADTISELLVYYDYNYYPPLPRWVYARSSRNSEATLSMKITEVSTGNTLQTIPMAYTNYGNSGYWHFGALPSEQISNGIRSGAFKLTITSSLGGSRLFIP